MVSVIESSTALPGVSAQTSVSLESLLDEMADRPALSRLCQPAYCAKAATSYDRESKVNNPADGLYVETNGRDWGKGWFANRDFGHCIRQEENDGRMESVIMEDEGPGAIVRWWAPACDKGMIRVYLDGAAQPVLEMKPDDLVGSDKLASYPFSFLASDDTTRPEWRGRNLYLPIPYRKSCKVTWEGEPFYYQINYRRYAEGTMVKTFSLEQLESAKETLQRVAERLTTGSATVSGKTVLQSNVVLTPEASTTLTLDTPGAITKLLVQLSAADYQQALRSTVITMAFDGEQTAWIPVGSLGGVGYSAEKNDTFYIKTDPATGTVSSYYVMPFRKMAEITLTNYGSQDVAISQFELTREDYPWDERSLYFHATWFELRNISTVIRRDLNYVTVKGAGRYVGTSITVFNTDDEGDNQTWWGEGDDKVYVDGESFPSIFGTGTEDYFDYAWCRPQRFYTPFASQPRGEGNKKCGYTNNNRHHLLDDIPFTSSVQFDMEIWHPFRKNMNYAAATFFYARPGATHNIEPDIDAVRHKVALRRDDVISQKEWAMAPIPDIVKGPGMDDPRKEWCYLAKSTTVVGVPFMPDPVMVTWDGAVYTRYAELCFSHGEGMTPVLQRQKTWLDGWIPIVQYDGQSGVVRYDAEIFNAPLEGGDVLNSVTFVKVVLRNTGSAPVDAIFASAIRGWGEDYRTGKPHSSADWTYAVTDNALIRDNALVYTFPPGATVEAMPGVPYEQPFSGQAYGITARSEVAVANYAIPLAPGEERVLEFKMPRVPVNDADFNRQVREADLAAYRARTVAYWQALMGRQCVIDVPEKRVRDAARANVVHALLATKTRNGERFQTDGVPYPNCFISTVFDYQKAYDATGLGDVAKTFALQLRRRQKEDGMFLDTSLTHGKVILSSHGQSLLGLCNHITMTRDQAFGDDVYPMIRKAVDCIATDHRGNDHGLMRPSWPYDNEMISGHYTSHNLWCLAALRKAIVVARYLGRDEDATAWLALHDSYEKAVLKAIDATAADDGYVPTGLYAFITGEAAREGFPEWRTDQDWENCLLAWPTEVLPVEDPRVTATTKRFRETKYREGIMSYRNGQHLHQYITANTANQDLLAGNAKQALLDIYHVLLHAGSTHEGFENEVEPWADRLVHGAQPPHAWGASKIATLVRNMFVMEHGGRLGLEPEKRNLHLFSVVSPAWAKPGETIAARNVLTDFGIVSAAMTFREGGATVAIDKTFHTDPGRIIVRIPYFVKDATFTSDAATSMREGNAICLSADATRVSFDWQLDPGADRTTFQEILLAHRREPGWWQDHRDKMPATPEGFLTEEESARQPEPLSFELVKEAFLTEYHRRGKWPALEAPAMQCKGWSDKGE